MVIARYFFPYSTVHHTSSGRSNHPWRNDLSSRSSGVSRRMDKPSRNCAGHQFGFGSVNVDLWAAFTRFEAVRVVFEETMIFDPKNLRISSSLSRCCGETHNRAVKRSWGDGPWFEVPSTTDRSSCDSRDSSARTLSKSWLSLGCPVLAFCFLDFLGALSRGGFWAIGWVADCFFFFFPFLTRSATALG